MKFSAEHIFHDVLAMPGPIPGTVCQISIVLCVALVRFIVISILLFKHRRQHIVQDVLAMPGPIPGTVCQISIDNCNIAADLIWFNTH